MERKHCNRILRFRMQCKCLKSGIKLDTYTSLCSFWHGQDQYFHPVASLVSTLSVYSYLVYQPTLPFTNQLAFQSIPPWELGTCFSVVNMLSIFGVPSAHNLTWYTLSPTFRTSWAPLPHLLLPPWIQPFFQPPCLSPTARTLPSTFTSAVPSTGNTLSQISARLLPYLFQVFAQLSPREVFPFCLIWNNDPHPTLSNPFAPCSTLFFHIVLIITIPTYLPVPLSVYHVSSHSRMEFP